MEFAITKMSSKGQIVIPNEIREGIPEGEKLVVIKNDHQWIIERMRDLRKNFKEDLEFAKRTEEAWIRRDEGKFKSMEKEEFLKEIKKW
ncbi:AbrB family transcriptional regulator [archaeon]|nr:AbrB family transcriptional regulator [archaeon]|tara:strand:+ start:1596 stop:1862 length:267 start_codon:yes stop_codon:yes gene_type:complete